MIRAPSRGNTLLLYLPGMSSPSTSVGTTWEVRPFRPAWWARGPHAQTMIGRLLRPSPSIVLERLRLDTPDDDFVDVDVAPEPGEREQPAQDDGADPERSGAPLVLVLHGLEGSSRRSYTLLTYDRLARRGLRAAGLNFRGCSGEPNLLPRAYHSGDTEDVAFVIGVLKERFPERPMGAVGFSLGGNVLLKYLGERGGDAGVDAAVAISVPFDLTAGSRALERGVTGRIYTYYFLRMLRKKLRAKEEILSGHVDVEAAYRTPTLRTFDDAVTAPLHGFRDAAHYYDVSSSSGYLDGVAVPTLILHALDDPFLPRSAVPVDAVEANPWLVGGFTERGGHVGFLEGSAPWSPGFWAERETARFLADHLGKV